MVKRFTLMLVAALCLSAQANAAVSINVSGPNPVPGAPGLQAFDITASTTPGDGILGIDFAANGPFNQAPASAPPFFPNFDTLFTDNMAVAPLVGVNFAADTHFGFTSGEGGLIVNRSPTAQPTNAEAAANNYLTYENNTTIRGVMSRSANPLINIQLAHIVMPVGAQGSFRAKFGLECCPSGRESQEFSGTLGAPVLPDSFFDIFVDLDPQGPFDGILQGSGPFNHVDFPTGLQVGRVLVQGWDNIDQHTLRIATTDNTGHNNVIAHTDPMTEGTAGPGGFHIDSFFDIFTELSFNPDGRPVVVAWDLRQAGGAISSIGVPVPAAAWLGAALLGLAGLRRRNG